MATTTRAKISNKPTLKSQGAGYSATNRKGETTYYKSSKDAPGYSDTANGKGVKTSSGSSISRVDAQGKTLPTNVITSNDLAPTNKIKLPPLATTQVPNIAANSVGFTDPTTGVTAQPNGMLSVTDPNQDKYAGANKLQNDFQTALDRLNMDAPSAGDVQRQLEKDTGLRQKQQSVNDFSAQLNTIVANRDANKLRLEGQGRGITDVIIGGQQAQIDKEAAISALPVQAQLAAAQGNLQLAQDHINTWGNILMKDAEQQYTRKKEVLTSVRDFAVGLEFKRIDDLDAANERKYQEAQTLTKAKTAALSQALGQGAPASVMNAIKGATTAEDVVAAAGIYNGDLLAQEAQRASIAASRASTANSYDAIKQRQVDITEAAALAATEKEKQALEITSKTEQALELKKLTNELLSAPGLGAAVGKGFKKSIIGSIPFVSGAAGAGTTRADFEAKAERVANLLTLENLDLMSGVLSETDIKILETSGSNLRNFNMSEAAYKAEIERVSQTMDRTIKANGISTEQAVFWGVLPESDVQTFDSIWETLPNK